MVADAFDRPEAALPNAVLPLRRFVMTERFNRDWASCWATFSNEDDAHRAALKYLARARPPKEIKHWYDLDRRDRVGGDGPRSRHRS